MDVQLVDPAPVAAAAQPQAAPTVSAVPAPPLPTPTAQTLPSPPTSHGDLSPAIAKIFGSGDAPQSVSLNVSYRVARPLDEIVTVFSDPATGKEIAQFPSEMIIQIAEFFDKQSGITLDRNA
ncbi:MAG: hypothetical protein M3Y21_10205 [Candidatus Eremiobacteraeota bacterium]|nr:hypothetical protein [Candidatus Eremiobacteraeota bacterium]